MAASHIPVLFVVFYRVVEGEIVEFLHHGTFGFDTAFDALLEVTCECRHGEHDMWAHLFDGDGDILERRHGGFANGHSSDGAAVGHHGIEPCHVCKAVVKR